MGELVDLRDELKIRHLANALVKDLGVPIEAVEAQGGAVTFATKLLSEFEDLPENDTETLEEDHPELFALLRKKAAG